MILNTEEAEAEVKLERAYLEALGYDLPASKVAFFIYPKINPFKLPMECLPWWVFECLVCMSVSPLVTF